MGPNGYGAVLGDIMARYYRNHGEEFDDSPQPKEETRLDISPCTLFTAATATAIINKEEYHETYRQFSDYYRCSFGIIAFMLAVGLIRNQ